MTTRIDLDVLYDADVIEQTECLIAVWESTGRAASTSARLGDLSRRFAMWLAANGVDRLQDATTAHCDDYIWTPTRRGNRPPSLHTVHLRRTAVRNLYRTAGQLDPRFADPTVGLDVPPKPQSPVRAVTDDELGLIRTAALGRVKQKLRAAAVISLCEATASTGELLAVRWDSVDLGSRRVALPGAEPILPRVGRLTDWGAGVLERTYQERTSRYVITRRGTATAHTGQAAMVNLVGALMRDAGLDTDALRPSSIRLWGATQCLRSDGIAAAARALGLSSLDAAAHTLGYRWQ